MRIGLVLMMLLSPVLCFAGNKEDCLEAHSRGQDYREKGQLKSAKKSFLQCAQNLCPNLVQSDCAKMGEEIDRMLPTVSFGARDSRGGDIPNTIVFVDGVQFASRLDDGKSYEIDPGAHSVRFVHDGKETALDVVMVQGEKGRFIAATFKDASTPAVARVEHAAPIAREEPSRSVFPLFVAGAGLAAVTVGSILVGVGIQEVPKSCDFSSRQCAAPMDDPAFSKAQGAVNLANAGIGIGVAGAITLIGGIVWYLLQPKSAPKEMGRVLQVRF